MTDIPMKTTTWGVATADATEYVCCGPELSKPMIRRLEAALRGQTFTARMEDLEQHDPHAHEAFTLRRDGLSLEAIARHQKRRVTSVKLALLRAAKTLGMDAALPDPTDMDYGERERTLRRLNPLSFEVYLMLSHGWTLARIGDVLGFSTSTAQRLSVIARTWMQEPQKRANKERRHLDWLSRQDTDVSTEVIQERMKVRDAA